MAVHIFVSHSSKDNKLAMTVAAALERRGLACWISSRDIGAGENFQEAIVAAIRGARAMVLVFSQNANESGEIKKELALASQYGVAVIPVRSESVVPTGAFKYELATRQWVDLFENWEQAIDRLCEQIGRIDAPASVPPTPVARRRPGRLATGLLGVAAALLVVTVAVAMLRLENPPQGAVHLRAAPAVLTGDEVAVALVMHDLYDAKRNPSGKGVTHRYAQQIIGTAEVISDQGTALMWQQGGSEDMTWSDAAAYIDKLNGAKYAGFGDWRLPTLEEAMSLMEPQASNDCHIDVRFRRPPFFIWTADRRPAGEGGFVVYFCDGAASGERMTFNASVRAVRSL